MDKVRNDCTPQNTRARARAATHHARRRSGHVAGDCCGDQGPPARAFVPRAFQCFSTSRIGWNGRLAISARTAAEIDSAVDALVPRGSTAIIVAGDAFLNAQQGRIAALAIKGRLLAVTQSPRYADAGGLMAYGNDNEESYRRAAAYVDKILKGARPGDVPVEQPTKFDLVLNLKTAKALGVQIPNELLLRASKVIE